MKRATLLAAAISVTSLAGGLGMTASSMAAGTLPTLKLTVSKNNVAVGGDKSSGAVSVAMTTHGEASDNPALVLLKPGITPARFAKVLGSLGPMAPADAIDSVGSVVFSGTATQGATTRGQVDLPPGTYVALNNGNAHTVFKVKRSAHPATLPRPDAVEKAIDFGFSGPAILHDGELVRFENAGFLVHMFQYAQVKSVADAQQAEADLLKNEVPDAEKLAIAPPGSFAGFLSSGAAVQETITQPPGVYVLFCSMTTQDGRMHYQLGMYRTIQIVK